jgi:hypothetical protein
MCCFSKTVQSEETAEVSESADTNGDWLFEKSLLREMVFVRLSADVLK